MQPKMHRTWRIFRANEPCSCCCDVQASIRLETTSRKTQPHVAQSHWSGSKITEHRSFLHVEEGSLSRTLNVAMLKESMPWRQREREREKWAGWARHIGQLAKLRFHPEHRWNMHSNITQSRHFFSKATALTDHWQTDSWLTFVGRFPGMARTMREHDGLPVRSSWTLASTHQPCTDNSTDRTMGHFIFSLKLKLQTKVRILIQPRGPVLNQTSD